ncbi:amino acid adenylation domain-containing protein [Cecembia lonarensis]|uniref:Tyrocidine synthase I n=1 Tax=Cecembia lonarensis (strain CCUG 58316 / KCTC 22772 / LW9) TaxID=1225176 RepID=K1L2T9_CECL9|nr:amino acid adenylation domain-containing protein [Cecembia lonarensis]EKB49126.1 Tyrocidine synthase I [Cecembia lonarensis LW9]
MIINILQYLEDSAQRVPEKSAFIDEKNSITYANLQAYAKSIGSAIIQKTKGQIRKPIVVFVDRNIESLVAFLGVAYSGNFYVPIDIQMPKLRVELILNTLNPVAMVVTPASKKFSYEVAPDLMAIDYEQAIEYPVDIDSLVKIRRKIVDRDPIYATFTSGSTGIPKGVITCHQSVIDMTEALVETFDFDENHVFGNQNPFYFDASIKDIYSSVKCGATMYVIPRSYFMMLGQLVSYINQHQIDTIMWSASAIALLANAQAFEEEKPTALKKVMFSGEVMHNRVLNYWRRNLPNTQFVNLYGPTEITSVCTYYKIEKPFADDEVLPIGIPFRNCEVLILNENNEAVKEGEPGELCVKGCCLALGYYNNPEKTAAAFCQNPLNPHFPELIYRTGDLARFNEYGEVMFMSRKDNQVKHMGQRVELGEIEILLNAMDRIDASICFYDHEEQKIIAVYKGTGADGKYIYGELRDKVSKFMFPNVLISLEELPYNLNGKIDRTLLKEKYFKGELS